jgi:hypothetical protein
VGKVRNGMLVGDEDWAGDRGVSPQPEGDERGDEQGADDERVDQDPGGEAGCEHLQERERRG